MNALPLSTEVWLIKSENVNKPLKLFTYTGVQQDFHIFMSFNIKTTGVTRGA